MSASVNRQIILAARPDGLPKESDFQRVESAIPQPADRQFLVRIIFLSVDPYLRGLMNEDAPYLQPVPLGGVMFGDAVGEVVQSNHPQFGAGEIVVGPFGWQEYAVSDGAGVRKVDPSLAPVSTALGVLGMPGMTAYFGLLDIGKPKRGETVVVSGAAGAVGSLVGQIARVQGCRVVGIAGSEEKVRYVVEELGFDGAINYKNPPGHYVERLRELCPAGVDVYFDNVGGTVSDAVAMLINPRARIVLCGQISQYNQKRLERGPRWLFQLVIKQARAEGFLVWQFADRFAEGIAQMARWLREGKIKYRETVLDGIENAPKAFIGMLTGQNIGKQLVKVGA
ncbi:MAG: NADP-dependent oxidoreductase [Candidatus Sumerlaeia bacterium]|nr:NADP-dependent oxidoreductase [Candidatus Sumerlaeia bacterium]